MAAHARATAQLDDARDTLADARAPCMSPRPRSPTTETTRRRRGSNVSRRLRTSKARRVLAWRTAARSAPGSASSRQRHTFAASSSTPASGVARRPPADCAASSSAASTTATVSVVTTGLAMPSSDSKYRVPGVVGADCPAAEGSPARTNSSGLNWGQVSAGTQAAICAAFLPAVRASADFRLLIDTRQKPRRMTTEW